jgi:hypothetical protein
MQVLIPRLLPIIPRREASSYVLAVHDLYQAIAERRLPEK